MYSKNACKQAIGVIFAGGDGQRLWPVSTPQLPKQVHPVFAQETLFVEAYERALLAFPREHIVVVTTEKLAPLLRHLVQIPEKNLVIQPHNADTTAAIALTALHLEILYPDSIAVMLFSDHKIYGLKNFIATIKHVAQLARKRNSIICIGTPPAYPETQYGYIKLGLPTRAQNLYAVDTFTEKPDKKTAELFIATGQYVWNTGVYVWRTSILLQEIKTYAPEIYQELLQLRIVASEKEYFVQLKSWFSRVERVSFEHKITEKLQHLFVYKADYSWQDIGNWESFYRSCPHDEQGNVLLPTLPSASVDTVQSTGCLVIPYHQRIALLGVRDLVVIQTDSTVFICNRSVAHTVKDIQKK